MNVKWRPAVFSPGHEFWGKSYRIPKASAVVLLGRLAESWHQVAGTDGVSQHFCSQPKISWFFRLRKHEPDSICERSVWLRCISSRSLFIAGISRFIKFLLRHLQFKGGQNTMAVVFYKAGYATHSNASHLFLRNVVKKLWNPHESSTCPSLWFLIVSIIFYVHFYVDMGVSSYGFPISHPKMSIII